MSIIELLEGPLWTASATIFVIFVLWRLASIIVSGPRRARAGSEGSPLFGNFIPGRPFWRSSRVWLAMLARYSFWLGLIVLVIFAAPHVRFLQDKILGFGWQPLPRWGFILAAEFAFAGLLVLWILHLVDPLTRQATRPSHHIATALTFLVLLSGSFALQESHVALRAIHLGLVELWLIHFPLSSLMHAFARSPSRGMTGDAAGRRGSTGT